MSDQHLPLTIIVLAKNEEKNLQELLPTLHFVSEILVINDGSTDSTTTVAKDHGAVVVNFENQDYSITRNWALSQASNKMVLFIDADERLNEKAIESLRNIFSKQVRSTGFAFKRVDYLWEKKIKYGEVGHTRIVRMGPKAKQTWYGKVHEIWQLEKPKLLEGAIEHYSHHSFIPSLKKINRYAKLEADSRKERGVGWTWKEITLFPLAKFFQNFFLRAGWRDGLHGLYYASLMSMHSLLVRFYQLINSFHGQHANSKLAFVAQICTLMAIGTVPFGQLLRLQIGSGVALYAFEVFMVISVMCWIGMLLAKPRLPVPSPWILSLLTFSLIMGVSLLANINLLQENLLPAALFWARWLIYISFGWMIWDGAVDQWLSISWKKSIEYIGFMLLFLGWLQYIFMPDMRWLLAYGWDDHYYRMIGSVLDPNFLGLLIVLYAIYILVYGKSFKYLIGAIVMVSLGLTYSRSSYVALVASVGMSLGLWKYLKQSTFYVLILGLSLLAFSSLIKPGGEGVNLARTYSIVHRARSIVTGWDVFRQHPFLGIGFNAYRMYTLPDSHDLTIPYHPSSPDNSFMLVLATTGIVGMLGFIYFLLSFVIASRKHPYQLFSLLAILTHSLFNNSFFYPFVLFWWMIVTLELIPEKKNA